MSQPQQDKRPHQNSATADDHFQEIYRNQAAAYHRMISAEDMDENILPALEGIVPFEGKTVLDMGTGTGRIPLLLLKHNTVVHAMDFHFPMLAENWDQRKKSGGTWGLFQADMQTLPVSTNGYDIVTAGWAIGHQRFWFERDWMQIIMRVVSEMKRVAKPGGHLIILETLGTGYTSPAPPAPELAEYYQFLEEDQGFVHIEIQTDYLFDDINQAIDQTDFFFGKELTHKIIENQWERLPEWTGIWSKVVSST